MKKFLYRLCNKDKMNYFFAGKNIMEMLRAKEKERPKLTPKFGRQKRGEWHRA